MQNRDNCYRYVWLLSGTGEGPAIAKALIQNGWKVFVSVVTPQAALIYKGLSLEDVWVGPFENVDQIRETLEQSTQRDKKKWRLQSNKF